MYIVYLRTVGDRRESELAVSIGSRTARHWRDGLRLANLSFVESDRSKILLY
jgi:hypothetical protein